MEAAEVDAWGCVTFCDHAMDWHSLRTSALFYGCQMDSHAHAISHAYHYCCTHCRGLCVMESIHEANLNHVGYRSSWTYHVPCHDFCHSPCH